MPEASAGPQSRRDAVRACGNGTEPRGAAAAPTRSRSALRGARTGAVGAVPRGGARPARTCATCGACSCGGAAPPSASRGGGAAPGRALGARPRPTPRSVAVAEPPGPSRRRRGPRRSGGRGIGPRLGALGTKRPRRDRLSPAAAARGRAQTMRPRGALRPRPPVTRPRRSQWEAAERLFKKRSAGSGGRQLCGSLRACKHSAAGPAPLTAPRGPTAAGPHRPPPPPAESGSARGALR